MTRAVAATFRTANIATGISLRRDICQIHAIEIDELNMPRADRRQLQSHLPPDRPDANHGSAVSA